MAANTRFAIAAHIMTGVALGEGSRINSEYLAKSVNTNPVVIRRILGDLKKAKLIVARTGKSGGAQLARPPKDISLYDIFDAVEGGPIFAFNPKPSNKHCPLSCVMKSLLEPIFDSTTSALRKQLEHFSLAELVSQARDYSISRKS